jgi:hypothetical protein
VFLNKSELTDRIQEAFDGQRCISAWLGYGDVLFMGFGKLVVPECNQAGQRNPSPFQLATNFADWSIEGPIMASSDETNRTLLNAAAESLMGEDIVSWDLHETMELHLAFTHEKFFKIVPWSLAEGLSDAWCLTSPDGRILAVATDGRSVVVDADLPVKEWFNPI